MGVGLQTIKCENCGTANIVATCSCGRAFVLTVSHVQNRRREYKDEPVSELPDDFDVPCCDFCAAKAWGDPGEAVNLGLRQRTCPVCHSEFLSHHNL